MTTTTPPKKMTRQAEHRDLIKRWLKTFPVITKVTYGTGPDGDGPQTTTIYIETQARG